MDTPTPTLASTLPADGVPLPEEDRLSHPTLSAEIHKRLSTGSPSPGAQAGRNPSSSQGFALGFK